MKDKRKAAPAGSGNVCDGSRLERPCKDNTKRLTPQQIRVFNLLSDGAHHTTADISAELKLSDPRGIIRNIRALGIVISDYWVNADYGRRFKRYFIRKEAING